MNALVTQRITNLAGTLAELKTRVRTALATELATAVGSAVRDVLIVSIIDRIVATPSRPPTRSPGTGWRDDGYDRDRWDTPKDTWSDDNDAHSERSPSHNEYDPDEIEPMPAIPAVAVVAVGVNVGRWWLAHHGTVGTAVGLGVLTTALGLTGGNFARAAMIVLAATTDLLTAESALARLDHS